jgi:hypothetical protein
LHFLAGTVTIVQDFTGVNRKVLNDSSFEVTCQSIMSGS